MTDPTGSNHSRYGDFGWELDTKVDAPSEAAQLSAAILELGLQHVAKRAIDTVFKLADFPQGIRRELVSREHGTGKKQHQVESTLVEFSHPAAGKRLVTYRAPGHSSMSSYRPDPAGLIHLRSGRRAQPEMQFSTTRQGGIRVTYFNDEGLPHDAITVQDARYNALGLFKAIHILTSSPTIPESLSATMEASVKVIAEDTGSFIAPQPPRVM